MKLATFTSGPAVNYERQFVRIPIYFTSNPDEDKPMIKLLVIAMTVVAATVLMSASAIAEPETITEQVCTARGGIVEGDECVIVSETRVSLSVIAEEVIDYRRGCWVNTLSWRSNQIRWDPDTRLCHRLEAHGGFTHGRDGYDGRVRFREWTYRLLSRND